MWSTPIFECSANLVLQSPSIPPIAKIDLNWHPPISSKINNLTSAINGTGTYGFIFNSSTLPNGVPYGTYNWCNMPHVRPAEYPQVNTSLYTLAYVEVIHRHHKRTPYSANTFPVESYPWDCDDSSLFHYASPLATNHDPAKTYYKLFNHPSNLLTPPGFSGTCQFPQITHSGLLDSFDHGKDLFQVYHTLLNFLPKHYDPSLISFRVTNNPITSQVASMIISSMFGPSLPNIPLLIQPPTIDSLEPSYPCPAAKRNFSLYGPGSSNSNWTTHLTAASSLFTQLDSISGVSPLDKGFHISFDHYFDNLSSRLCHSYSLPCNITNPSLCITQEMADTVFRLGEYEYSYLYRDAGPQTLEFSVGIYGIWIAELTQNIRDVVIGGKQESQIKYRHNVAHDGSISYILSILQVEEMVWPGMGSEIVFELYQGKENKKYYIRILWGGQVLRSSNPTLGVLDLIDVEILLDYFDGLIGKGAEKIPGLCSL